jgi:PglZ domain
LPTVIREAAIGRAAPAVLERFLARDDVTVASADAWLAGLEHAAQDGAGPDLGALGPEALFDELVSGGHLALQLDQAEVARAVRRRAAITLGIDEDWYTRGGAHARVRAATEQAAELAAKIAGWSMCVEFVHDLRRPAVDDWLIALKHLPRPAVAACQKLAIHLRERHPVTYARIADEVEVRLENEVREATAADLGKIDTFRFEDRIVLAAALDALGGARFQLAYDFTIDRTASNSFWPQLVRGRQIAWNLVLLAAQLGRMVVEHPALLDGAGTLAEALERYATAGFEVDGAHRRLEQARHQLAHLEIEEASLLRERLDQLRTVVRGWADPLAATFNGLCRAEGFVPGAALQQRTIFDEVVAPAANEELTAYFMVDGLRFEMGAQLAASIAPKGESHTTDVVVKARFAELPTVTEVGMNALAPLVQSGKLAVDFREGKILGVRAGTVRVDGPKARHRAMHERVGGATCPHLSLEEVIDRTASSLRQTISRAKLVVVHCEGIDKAGEKGVGLAVFERELQNLRAAWRLLYEAGVKRFVITADHGFLLHDGLTREALAHGKLTDPQRRHVLSAQRRDQTGEVTVFSQDLGYEGDAFFVTFPETTAPFDRGERMKDFVHGGNSLQERVIPVITIRHRHAAGGDTVAYVLEVTAGRPVTGMHRLHAKVVPAAQASLSYGGSAELELALEAAEGSDVQVELCDAPDARLGEGCVVATVGQTFEILFRLSGDAEGRVPVRLRHATRSAAVAPSTTAERFQVVLRTRAPAVAVVPAAAAASAPEWLALLPDGVREVFRHLAEHGSINEQEATRLLGGARQFRNFSLHLDDFRHKVPFAVRVDVSSGTKCYVRGDQ